MLDHPPTIPHPRPDVDFLGTALLDTLPLMRVNPAFVVTFLGIAQGGLACRERTAPDPIQPDPAPTATTSKVAEPTPPKSARKRKRTSPASEPKFASASTPWSSMTALNPSDAHGRAIHVSTDDSCFVEVPMKDPPKNFPTGFRAVDQKIVDCPIELDDAAWDNCAWGTLYAVKGEANCLCGSLGGNPPPPPRLTTCPTSK